MNEKVKDLIKKIYDLSVNLYYEVADDRMLRCGHPGVMGPPGNDENFRIEWGELAGAIKTLEQVGDKIINPKTIAIISFDVEDFKRYMITQFINIRKTEKPKKIKCGFDTYYCISDICDMHSISFNEIIETDYAKENKNYEQIKQMTGFNLKQH